MTIVDSIHGTVTYYCWWSLFYALGPMIWFYPLNELDITGYEAFAAIWLIPIITAGAFVRRVLFSERGSVALELGMMAGIYSFQMPSTLSRLQVLSAGNGAAMLYFCGKLFAGSRETRIRQFWLLMGGHFIFLASRLIMTSIAPAWADHRTNWMIFSIFAVSIITRVLLKLAGFAPSENKENTASGGAAGQRSKISSHAAAAPPAPLASTFRQITCGLLTGSLFYLTHWIFGELGVLSRWAVRGVTAPPSPLSPFHTAPLVLLALSTGMFLPYFHTKTTSSFNFWLAGTVTFFGTYFLHEYAGFFCGLFLAVWCSVVWVWSVRRWWAVGDNPALVMTVAMVTYLAQIFFHVWTVAYNFVPGGVYTRERSDALIGVMCLAMLTAFGKFEGSIRDLRPPNFFRLTVFIALIVAGAATVYRLPRQPQPKNLNPDTRDLSAVIWTFHFGYDNQGWPSLHRAADVLQATNADVIALLESDASKPYLGHNDLALWLSETLGMYVDFGPATKDHTWGNLLLSKYPIVTSTHHLLPSPEGELAPAISAVLNVSGHLVTIISTHMGNDRDHLDRELQTHYLANLSASSPHPVIFLGYVTSKPFSRDYLHLTEQGRLKDIDPTDRQRFCEYIMYRGLGRVGYARISHGGLSDTELQMGRFVVGSEAGEGVVETREDAVPAWMRFSPRFGGFTPGHYAPWRHHYHMSTPKYFLDKTGS